MRNNDVQKHGIFVNARFRDVAGANGTGASWQPVTEVTMETRQKDEDDGWRKREGRERVKGRARRVD